MKRIAIALLTLLCIAGCSERAQRLERLPLRSYTHCPYVVRLAASGSLFVSDCTKRKQATFATLTDGLEDLFQGEEWEKLPRPVVVDIDDATPLSLTHQVFNRLQDTSVYSFGVADGAGRQPIMIAIPPLAGPTGVTLLIEPGAPFSQNSPVGPAAVQRIVTVTIRKDHQVEVTEYPFKFSSKGFVPGSPKGVMTVTTTVEALPSLLATYPKGRWGLFYGQSDTPWSEIKDVLRALAQVRRDQIVLLETPY